MKMIIKRSVILILMILLCFSSSVSAGMVRFTVPLMEEIFFPLPEPAVDYGKDASFGVMVYHDGCTFQWYSEEGALVDGKDVIGSTTDTLTLMAVECSDNGKRFRCEVTDGDMVASTEWMVLTVNHVFDCEDQNEKTLIKKATCKEKGACYYSCACGELADRIFFIDTVDHHGGIATCKARAICEDCGESYGDLSSHMFGDWQYSDEFHWKQCLVCREKHGEAKHVPDGDVDCMESQYCKICLGVITPPLGHIFTVYHSNNDATCLLDGTETAVCDHCEVTHTRRDVGSALGHCFTHYVYQNDSTCFSDGTEIALCERCGITDTRTKENSKTPHSYMMRSDKTKHWLECVSCKTTKEYEDHKGGVATCIEKAHCEICGKEYGKTVSHVFDQKIAEDVYRFAKADCMGSALYYYSCVCGMKGEEFFAYGDPLPHKYDGFGFDENVHYSLCSVCGKRHTDTAEEHIWVLSDESSIDKEIFECMCGAKKYHYMLPFHDVDENDWFYDDVIYVYHHGLLRGMKDDTFGPDTVTSRAMIVTILYRLEGEPQIGADNFDDVSATDWYGSAVLWAAEIGVVNGYGNGLFGPDDDVTREQIASILYRYAQYKKYNVSVSADLKSFPDQDTVSVWAEDSLCWAVGEGLINGVFENGTVFLNPQDNALRCQIAAILHRFQLLNDE